ncbi:uncharacterized protein LOC134193061 isoform X2 [Corticium candelabrum]|uniref:uncharacterized protein LOC134193061 isoform X2 n=1 Tax=Corticium candelabrum TaxID=121492 RepID=UPI002E2774B1|nr:uncharacterized protein LOC134193061 isoform X2 [Corticium candelabrum]
MSIFVRSHRLVRLMLAFLLLIALCLLVLTSIYEIASDDGNTQSATEISENDEDANLPPLACKEDALSRLVQVLTHIKINKTTKSINDTMEGRNSTRITWIIVSFSVISVSATSHCKVYRTFRSVLNKLVHLLAKVFLQEQKFVVPCHLTTAVTEDYFQCPAIQDTNWLQSPDFVIIYAIICQQELKLDSDDYIWNKLTSSSHNLFESDDTRSQTCDVCCQPTQLQCISVRACGKDGSLPQLPMNPPSDGGTHSDNANDAQLGPSVLQMKGTTIPDDQPSNGNLVNTSSDNCCHRDGTRIEKCVDYKERCDAARETITTDASSVACLPQDDKHFVHLALFGVLFQQDVGSRQTLKLELHMLESIDTLKKLIDIYKKSDPSSKLIAGPSNAIGINRSSNMKLEVVNKDFWIVKNTPEELQTPLNNIWAAKHFFKFPNSMFLEYVGTAQYRPEIVIAVNYSGNTETLTGHPSMQPQQTSSTAIGTTVSGLNFEISGANNVFAGQNVNVHNHFWQET